MDQKQVKSRLSSLYGTTITYDHKYIEPWINYDVGIEATIRKGFTEEEVVPVTFANSSVNMIIAYNNGEFPDMIPLCRSIKSGCVNNDMDCVFKVDPFEDKDTVSVTVDKIIAMKENMGTMIDVPLSNGKIEKIHQPTLLLVDMKHMLDEDVDPLEKFVHIKDINSACSTITNVANHKYNIVCVCLFPMLYTEELVVTLFPLKYKNMIDFGDVTYTCVDGIERGASQYQIDTFILHTIKYYLNTAVLTSEKGVFQIIRETRIN